MSNFLPPIKLVVGLGNPGKDYVDTRHNVGQMVFNYLSYSSDLKWQKSFKGQLASKVISERKVFFLFPLTYMNLSGESVREVCHFHKISSDEIFVIHDELDLPFGQIGFKKGGGLAGHNGLKSITACLGNQNFLRMRIGISRPQFHDVKSWVLSEFSKDEKIQLQKYLETAAMALESALNESFEKAASLYSKKIENF